MAGEIRSLPVGSIDEFIADRRNIGAAESCLRRAIEALLDLGRHLLGKAFGVAVTEYKQIQLRFDTVNPTPEASSSQSTSFLNC
jgi:uncharacterized protein YutE (UPF0331/DUF86 family)